MRRPETASLARLTSLACALLLPLTAAAQPSEGLYSVVGTDAALGPYSGQLELRDQGGFFTYVRQVSYQNPAPGGQPLSTVWTGHASPVGNVLHVSVPLARMGWITELNGLQRTSADQQPDVVTGALQPDPSGGFSGVLSSPGGISLTEVIARTGPLGAQPLFVDGRRTEPAHGAPPGWLKNILFSLFSNYHTLPEIVPYLHRPEFQAAQHSGIVDRTGFAWLRQNPGSLLVFNKRVDPISLREAELRRNAYGLRLFEKAASFDRDAETRHRDVTGLMAFGVRPNPSQPNGLEYAEDMSTALWSGCYVYGQSCRYQVTQDPQALQNVIDVTSVLCDMVEIDPRVGEFARSLRPIGRAPLGGSWVAGTGRFSHLAYHTNGNNDMVKGLWMGFIGAWSVLPANHPLRARMITAMREIADHWQSSTTAGTTGNRRDSPKNRLVNNMLAFWMTGESRYETAYRRAFREPLLLAELATGGTFQAYGIADWSGTHLGICSNIALLELGQQLNTPWQVLFAHSLRMSYGFVHDYRMTLYSVAMAAFLNDAGAADEALWQLREFPYPKPNETIDRTLDPTFCYSPYPSLPWKLDWMTNAGRKQSLFHYPVFMRSAGNYYYRSSPLNKGGNASGWEHGAPEFLYAYWLARRGQVVSATE